VRRVLVGIAAALGAGLAVLGLFAVGYFVVLAIALSQWGGSK
jgi:hypothetical protein